jgi:hypothetical protein
LTSEFGKTIKKRLIDLDKNQNWLIEEIRRETGGMFIDSSYLQKILNGNRSPQKIVDAICRILEIPCI